MKLSLLIGLVLCLAGSACTRPQPASVQTQPTITQPSPSPSPSPAVPVQLAGLVNNMGVKDFSGVGTNIAVELQIKDFSFTPTFVKALPGTNVNIQLDNMGQAEHTFTIDSLKVDHKLAPGGQIEGQFKLPDSGIIPFYCRFHVGQGMQGAFYFQEGGAVAASPSPTPDEASATSSSGTRRRSASSSRRSPAQAPAGTAQTREGDLVVPDLVIGGVEAGKTTATTLPRALPAASPRSSPRPGSTAVSKAAPKKAASGAPGKPSDPGTAGEEGEQGTPGEDGDTDNNTN